MTNVYKKISEFYIENDEYLMNFIEREEIEKFFRRRAWQGKDDDELQNEWSVVREFIFLASRSNIFTLNELQKDEMQEIIYRAIVDEGQELTELRVTAALKVLKEFLATLPDEDQEALAELLKKTQNSFYRDNKFEPPPRPPEENFYTLFADTTDVSDEQLDSLNDVLDGIMQNTAPYFADKGFHSDVRRATAFFVGDGTQLNLSPDQVGEVWQNFWDFFLFDYHLLREDITPLRFFLKNEKDHLSETERGILSDLQRSQFRVFYVVDVIESEFMDCRDLFTDEEFELPCPDDTVRNYRQTLLYGHFHTRGFLLLNSVSIVTASPKLRQRIKNEILRQYEIFRYQWPQADIDDFLSRHSAAVRHLIHILARLDRLNVVPTPEFPRLQKPTESIKKQFAAAEKRLLGLTRRVGLSTYSLPLVFRLYEDFVSNSSLSLIKKRRYDTLLAVIVVFLQINLILPAIFNRQDFPQIYDVVRELGLEEDAIRDRAREIEETLELKPFDPRYIAEEGFVFSLFAQKDLTP